MPEQQLLEGSTELYEQFLGQFNSASLLEISRNFQFSIRTIQAPNLVWRQIRIQGRTSNQLTYGDAFIGLILSHRPGGFSSTTPLTETGTQPEAASLHWHWPDQLAISHHQDSDVTYLRLESAALLRQLALQGLQLDQLRQLQGVSAPPGLIQLLNTFSQRLIATTGSGKRRELVDELLADLALELRRMLGESAVCRSSGVRHVSAAIEHMAGDLAASLSMSELAAALGLTPRAIQACFRSCVALSPMRWLKLARFSRLRQLLHCPELSHLSSPALMARVGLSSNSLNRQQYREVYGLSPADDQLRAERRQSHGVALSSQDSQSFHFTSVDAAVTALQAYKQRQSELPLHPGLSVLITISVSTASGPSQPQPGEPS